MMSPRSRLRVASGVGVSGGRPIRWTRDVESVVSTSCWAAPVRRPVGGGQWGA
jgi:hypothetical protein